MLTSSMQNFAAILKIFAENLQSSIDDFAHKRRRLKLPIIPLPILIDLLDQATNIFKNEPTLLDLKFENVIVVGDLHGHILDLIRILKTFGFPSKICYIFLGDLVDRGKFSTETVVLVLILKVLYNENVYIIRGNHEFAEMYERFGFLTELASLYGSNKANDKETDAHFHTIVKSFDAMFSQMPLAAKINNYSICIHGGIGPTIENVQQIADIKRPISIFQDNQIVPDLLWSDPSERINLYLPSNRGMGNLFGKDVLAPFLKNSNLKLLIRGHQCIQSGCEYALDNMVATVFSASNYCGVTNNKAGVLIIKQEDDNTPSITIQTFDPIPSFDRLNANFIYSDNEYVFKIRKHSVSNLCSFAKQPKSVQSEHQNYMSPISPSKLCHGGKRTGIKVFPYGNQCLVKNAPNNANTLSLSRCFSDSHSSQFNGVQTTPIDMKRKTKYSIQTNCNSLHFIPL